MQKKKKTIAKKKDKTVKKTVAKPAAKKVAKKVAQVKPSKSKVIEKAKKAVVKPAPIKAEKINQNKEALKQANQKNKKTVAEYVYVPSVDTKTLSPAQLEDYKKWLKLHKQHIGEQAPEYKMTQEFEIKSTLKHKIHGWGVVLQRRDNYIDVLFEKGMKTLICNYKAE